MRPGFRRYAVTSVGTAQGECEVELAPRRRDALPTVSVVMPVRGDGRFLEDALKSVYRQCETHLEIICVDDGLTHHAETVIREFNSTARNIRILRNNGRGIVAALNTGLREACGEFVARMDADDISLPNRFAAQLTFLRRHPDVAALGTQAMLIDEDGKVVRRLRTPVGSARLYRALDVSCAIIHPTVMMRLAAIRKLGGYRVGFDGAEDYELWLRLRRVSKLDNLPGPFLLYRSHTEQVSVRNQLRQARMAAIASVGHRLLSRSGVDHLAAITSYGSWRSAFGPAGPAAVDEVRGLTACLLADNGGTNRRSGARYLDRACAKAGAHGSPYLRNRLALACVRHQISLARSGRRMDALIAAATDLSRWRTRLVPAYFLQASALWRSREALSAERSA